MMRYSPSTQPALGRGAVNRAAVDTGSANIGSVNIGAANDGVLPAGLPQWCLSLLLCACLPVGATFASEPDRSVRSPADLEYGAVLFEYYQQDYFNGLIEQAYVSAIDNPRAQLPHAQLLKGSMALSYGLPDVAQPIFDQLLAERSDEALRNRAWYHLAKLYHSYSKPAEAFAALENIRGQIPADLRVDYHYLATLVSTESEHLENVQEAVSQIPAGAPQYPYLLFNLGVSHLEDGNQTAAAQNLQAVVSHADESEEVQILADRARHGLAQIAIQQQRLPEAWAYLQDIRTEGLYSSRALLAYAWTAIRQEMFSTALPALQLLNRRSIALAEVQQGKVLLGHIYEQQGAPTRALKSHLEAEAAFAEGLEQLTEARRIVEQGELPRELLADLDAVADTGDWQGTSASSDYTTLAPFLVDLMASNAFHQVQRNLTELYTLRDNLAYWARQTDQHTLILRNAEEKIFSDNMKQAIADSARLHERLRNQRKELGLFALTLDTEEQRRFNALFQNTSRELAQLDDKLRNLKRQSEPYRQPPEYPAMVAKHHQQIAEQQEETEHYIGKLEPAMRNLVKAELNKHEERMHYYLAQARLAKARLYDTALTNLNRSGTSANESERGGRSP